MDSLLVQFGYNQEPYSQPSPAPIIAEEPLHCDAEKVCPKCKKELPITAFNRQSRVPDGRQNVCRDCKRAYREQPLASPELLAHLKAFPAHALGRYRKGEICAHCDRLGCNPAVCLECGRMGFADLYKHLIVKHSVRADGVYRDKYGYRRTTPLVSPPPVISDAQRRPAVSGSQ
jgi:hypothetical protein